MLKTPMHFDTQPQGTLASQLATIVTTEVHCQERLRVRIEVSWLFVKWSLFERNSNKEIRINLSRNIGEHCIKYSYFVNKWKNKLWRYW